jgi:preprotein translocase subunit SecB
MAENPAVPPASSPASPTADALAGQSLQIGIGTQYVKDFSFESPSAPQIFTPTQAAPEINVGVNVNTRAIGDNTYEVALALKLEAAVEKKTAYIAELSYAGIFIVPPMPEENLKLFLLIEAPRLLFPFARAIIANAVRDGGFTPVMLSPIDFMALYQANKNTLGVVATAGAA